MSIQHNIIFPVEVPYAMRPNLRSLSAGESVITHDHDFDRYQSVKLDNYGPIYGDSATADLVYAAARSLKSYDASAPDIQGDAPVWQMTRQLQEDFVIWAPNKRGDLSAQILSVCMPSGWDPRSKVNKTFLEIHEPIPDFDVVNKAADHIANMMVSRGPFIRHVWTICNRPTLSRHPDKCEPWQSETLDDMWFRVERQVTVPVENRAALFLIRVYMYPLRDVFQDTSRKQKIIESIQSMTDAVVDYKNLGYVREWFFNRRV